MQRRPRTLVSSESVCVCDLCKDLGVQDLDPCLSEEPGVQESVPGSRSPGKALFCISITNSSLYVSKCCFYCDYQNCLVQMGQFLCKSTMMVFSAANNTGYFPAWLLGWTCCTKLSLLSRDAFFNGVMPSAGPPT